MLSAPLCAIPDSGVDLKHPSAARVYDYLLGGTANWAIDRAFARRVLANFPEIADMAVTNRMFLNRVVRHLSRLGVRQFVDIGSGVLSKNNTHQIADETDPHSRVVYVENESVAVAHAEVLLDEDSDPDRHTIVTMDFREPDELWDEVLATRIIDLDQPIALLMLSVLHTMEPRPDDDAAHLVARYRKLLPVGSYLVISHVTNDEIPYEIRAKLVELKHLCDDWFAGRVFCRSREAIGALLGDFEPVPPGMVWTPAWHPEEAGGPVPLCDTPSLAAVWAGVGQKAH